MKLATLHRFALALPGTVEQPHFDYGSFRVNGRIYATLPPGGEFVHVFGSEDDRERAFAMAPGWADKVLWGGKVVGVRVTLADAPAAAVKALLEAAWRYKAVGPAVRRRNAGRAAGSP
jgi:hypothetical protein